MPFDLTLTAIVLAYTVAWLLEASRLFSRAAGRGPAVLGLVGAVSWPRRAIWAIGRLRRPASPLSSSFDWCLLAAWLLVAAYLYLTVYHPRGAIGLVVLPLALLLIAAAALFADRQPIAPQPASQLWGAIHGIFLLLGTVTVMIGFAAGVLYLVQASRLKRKLPAPGGLRLPSLEWLDRINSRVVVISVILVAIGFLAGRGAERGRAWQPRAVVERSGDFELGLDAGLAGRRGGVWRSVQAGTARPQSGLSDGGQLWLFAAGAGDAAAGRHGARRPSARATRKHGRRGRPRPEQSGRWRLPKRRIRRRPREVGHEAANDRLQPSSDRRRRFASGWRSMRPRPAWRWTICGSVFPRPRRCCCRPAIGWRSTPLARMPARVPSHEEMAQFMADFHGLPMFEIFDDLFERTGDDAIRHLFTVAASLDSMVVGEPQILAQVKQAYELATARESTGPLTHGAFQAAVRVARRVTLETTIHRRRVSIPSVAVADFASEVFESFDDKRILLIGAGEMAAETLRYLQDQGAHDVTVVNRNAERARAVGRGSGKARPSPGSNSTNC